MHQSVADYVWKFMGQFEGKVSYMYLDIKGLVSIGIGNLIDPLSDELLGLGFVHKSDGTAATQDEIRNDWNAVKGRQDLSHTRYTAFDSLTQLSLPDEAIYGLCNQKLALFVNWMKAHIAEFSDFDSWPADAQLALIGMAWGMGPGFASNGAWPNFRAACKSKDFVTAAKECLIPEANAGRNAAHKLMFENAANNLANGGPVEVLSYPATLLQKVTVEVPAQADAGSGGAGQPASPGAAPAADPPDVAPAADAGKPASESSEQQP